MKAIAISRSDGGVSIMQAKHKVITTPRPPNIGGVTIDVVERNEAEIAGEVAKWSESAGDLKVISWAEIDPAKIPADRTFRNAWTAVGDGVGHDMGKVRILAHVKRRAARDAEMAPYDAIIAKQIPGADAKAAEDERKKIRDKYAAMQVVIDQAETVEAVKAALA